MFLVFSLYLLSMTWHVLLMWDLFTSSFDDMTFVDVILITLIILLKTFNHKDQWQNNNASHKSFLKIFFYKGWNKKSKIQKEKVHLNLCLTY